MTGEIQSAQFKHSLEEGGGKLFAKKIKLRKNSWNLKMIQISFWHSLYISSILAYRLKKIYSFCN